MKRTIIGQTIASTHLDAQGEQLSINDLQAIFNGLPPRFPLTQHHDFNHPVCGEIYNIRLESDPKDPSHARIVCDVEYDDDLIVGKVGGFSWSAFSRMQSNSADPEFEIYLPFPHYKDEDLRNLLLGTDTKLVVGKLLMKAAEPWLIAFIVIVLRPFWETAYKQLLEEKIKRFIQNLKEIWPKDTSLNASVTVPIQLYEPPPTAIFLPPKESGIDGLDIVPDGIEIAKKFCESDFSDCGKQIRQIKLSYDLKENSYKILGVDYIDGTCKPVATMYSVQIEKHG